MPQGYSELTHEEYVDAVALLFETSNIDLWVVEHLLRLGLPQAPALSRCLVVADYYRFGQHFVNLLFDATAVVSCELLLLG